MPVQILQRDSAADNLITDPQPQPDDRLTDQSLLRRFVQDSDAEAFADIVRRHGSLVMAVCRRVSGQMADAEDAFQATFLALARRPRSVRNCRSLTGWLYSVAFRTSVRMVRLRSRQAMVALPEQPAAREPDPLELIAADREIAVLDEELNSLPQKYRDVLVMTYFGHQSSQQIADQLNESRGVIDGRLRQARNLLRVRLARRSVAIGTIAVAAGLTTASTSVASPSLIQSTIDLGAQALGHPVPSPVDVTRLDPLIRPELTMLSAKLLSGLLLGAVVTVAGLTSGTGHLRGDGKAAGEIPGLDGFSKVAAEQEGSAADAVVAELQPLPSVYAASSNVPVSAGPDEMTAVDIKIENVGHSSMTPAADNRYPGFSSSAKRQAADLIYRQLEQKTPEISLESGSLGDVLQQINDKLGASAGKMFPFHIDSKELEHQGITSVDDISVTNIQLRDISLESALNIVLSSVPDMELDYVVRDETLMITTREAAEMEESMFNRVYDVQTVLPLFKGEMSLMPITGAEQGLSEFAGLAGDMGGAGGSMMGMGAGEMPDGMGGMAGDMGMGPPTKNPPQNADGRKLSTPAGRLIETVMQMSSSPTRWQAVDSEGGRIVVMGNLVMVRQSRRGHKAVFDVLEQLEEAAAMLTPQASGSGGGSGGGGEGGGGGFF